MNYIIECGTCVRVPQMVTLKVQNPNWDGDKPDTQFFMLVEPLTSAVVELKDNVSVRVLTTGKEE